ncbi:metal ABC transporter ATP-binding protein [Aureimonas phyllosphaerae]|uniref:Zinc/manganese transport system ATP-binding protein n=1 Tax=Aureimonas phyllosphaerae TaxID=1166078 RepID=A0A7W6C0C4_9HYPH|nr:ABC transporter ATP-binding protein [Aureimonas phyllosphaerae]MBB3936042.1 zinc/manganese transport system ATP-binding protein [Aureimonas phyllosphaerae]MBB3960233.1 zinc/manganese transport system ATP-binding protein [Aureimonas phyllosphaerae]SFF35382.1 zinc/manganese transport system ATP-binding protein [Aureimonas phyllosphaerae]
MKANVSAVAPSVELSDLTLAYRRRPAVRGLSGRFAPGSMTAVVGPNGAGKSTLLKGIMGSVRAAGGKVRVDGVRRRDIGYLPQVGDLDRTFPISVLDLVSLGLWRRTGPFGRVGRDLTGEVEAAIAAVGLEGLEDRLIGTMSGGQLQRALFARLLLQNARLLLLDEPFTAIDARTTRDLMDLVKRWNGEGRTVIAVLHDMDLVREYFPETLLLARERVAWSPTGDALAHANLARAQALSEGLDTQADALRSRAA